MSNINDGLSSYYSFTAKINALKNQSVTQKSEIPSPTEALLALKQSEYANSTLASSEEEENTVSAFLSHLLSLFQANQQSTAVGETTALSPDHNASLMYNVQMSASKFDLEI